MKTINFFLSLLFLASGHLSAQDWTRIENLPATEFTALEVIDGTLFAATNSQLYYTTDAQQWQMAVISPMSVELTCLTEFAGKLYVGTNMHGIFSASPGNLTDWNQNIGTLLVSSFAQRDGVLYVSTVGHGLYRSTGNGQFDHFSNDLPSYSFNVSKVISAPAGLIATAGANGTFYRYDVPTSRWIEDYYNSGYSAGLHMDDAIRIGNTIYASRFNKLLRSEDSGQNWVNDQVGLQNGHYRFLYAGQETFYTLTNIFTGDANITFLRKRKRNAPIQTSWAAESEVLPFYTYGIREFAGNLFAAAHNGFYAKFDPNLGTENPMERNTGVVVYPNPSSDGYFTVKNDRNIDELAIFDMTGKQIEVLRDCSEIGQFDVGPGLFLLKVVSENTVHHFKIISQK